MANITSTIIQFSIALIAVPYIYDYFNGPFHQILYLFPIIAVIYMIECIRGYLRSKANDGTVLGGAISIFKYVVLFIAVRDVYEFIFQKIGFSSFSTSLILAIYTTQALDHSLKETTEKYPYISKW